jgi:hypothetical protein
MSFPPYELLDAYAKQTDEKSKKLERLYHLTQEHAWDPRQVLDELERKHGGIHVPPAKKEALGHLFSNLMWGELAAWNIAADLALMFEEVDAKMAATGQAFDEARHFTVLRDYLRRAEVPVPPLNPYAERLFTRLLETKSVVRKLYGMQLLVENLALSIFKQLAETNVEPVLTELLTYIERDESRHVALGILHVPRLMARASAVERAANFAFSMEMMFLSIAGGELLDPHFRAMGLDHRALGVTTMRTHERVLRQMKEELGPGQTMRGIRKLSRGQQAFLVDFLHPDESAPLPPQTKALRKAFGAAVRAGARVMSAA